MRSADLVRVPWLGRLLTRGGTSLFLVAALVVLPAAWAADIPPDAVIQLWEQRWTLHTDGSQVYEEKKHVQLNDERAYREFADPRIPYHADSDRLEIMVARVRRPDGTYRELPPYAHVEVSPDASVGWPAFAHIRQHLLVMSGIEPGCVVELEYRVTSPPDGRRPLAADLRVDHTYPVRERLIEVSVPTGTKLAYVLCNTAKQAPREQTGPDRLHTYRWTFREMPPAPDEPQAPPWQARCPRLAFTVGGPVERWVETRLDQIEAAADRSEAIEKLATEWTRDQLDPRDKVRAIQQQLATTFNFVEFDVSWRPATLRPASQLVQCNYGLPEEAAALFLALVRAAGVEARPVVVVRDEVWLEDAPQDGMVAAWALDLVHVQRDVSTPGRDSLAEVWDARAGRVTREGTWAGSRILSRAGPVAQSILMPWRDPSESRLLVSGKVRVAADGNYTADVSLRTTGVFATAEKLRAADAQKARIAALLNRVLPEVTVESFTVAALTDGVFEVNAKVKSAQALKKLDGRHLFQLPADGPALLDVPLPLSTSSRRLPVRPTAPFAEDVVLSLELPEGATIELTPAAVPRCATPCGSLEQSVECTEKGLLLRRTLSIARPELSADDFGALRAALNTLRAEFTRTAVIAPSREAQ